ncbi:MHS family MFS transporter [Pseudonocardia sp. C8]|nr:MHS family MFS transporter [Pseudonocardia sp. C8]
MARKAGVASFVGTTVEWYDFYLYGTASALVFAPLFFSNVSPAIGVLLSFATFWVGFLARPVGGIVFGHLGDRVGRKHALIVTLLLMGAATCGIGLLPTYGQIGVTAPILLTLLRALQGVAVGGEWGGAVLIATEHARKDRGVLFGAFAQQGSPTGQILATLSFLLVTQLPHGDLHAWGWRLPFLASAVLVVVGLIIRLRIEETPAMAAVKAGNKAARVPVLEVLRNHIGTVLLAVCAASIAFTAGYFKNTFALSWATNEVGFTKDTFLSVVLIATLTQFAVQPFGAIIAHRWGIRRTATVLLLAELPLLPLMFWLISTGDYWLAVVGMVLATLPHVMFYALLAGLLAQAFPAPVRYTAISLAYGLAGTLLGGTAPVLGQALLTGFGTITPVVVYAMITVLLSLAGTHALLAVSRRRARDAEHEAATPSTATSGH